MGKPWILFIVWWFAALPLGAQEVTADYDQTTQVLTIHNNSDHVATLKYKMAGQPKEFKLGAESSRPISNIVEYLDNPDTLTIYLLTMEGMEAIRVPVEILGVQPDESANSAVSQSDEKHLSQTVMTKVLLGGILAILLMIILCLGVRKKKKMKEDVPPQKSVMQVVEEEKNAYRIGLDHVYQNANQYFVLNMEEFFLDTAVKRVYISQEMIRKLNTYFKSFLENSNRTNETGCYLVGAWETVGSHLDQYNVSLEEIVEPGADAVYDEYSLNFGLTIGIKLGSCIQNISEKTGRDYVHTAWMHSHPGLGLFLSSHDLVVQKQLTYSDAPKRLIAIVIDTNTPDWRMSVFTAQNNGNMNNKEDMLKTISFDVLNDWVRNPSNQQNATPVFSLENSFVMQSPEENDVFAFSPKAINLIDDYLFSTLPADGCYLKGVVRRLGNRRITAVCSCEAENGTDAVGRLFFDKEDDMDNVAVYQKVLGQFEFCLVYRSNQQFQLIYQNAQDEIKVIASSLKEMKEWTRRKRI